jgi:hypothetical protein
VDEFITLIIFFIVIGVLERVLKAAKGKKAPPQQAQGEPEVEGEETSEGIPASLQELIAEELGINLERRPKVRELPEQEQPSRPALRSVKDPAGRRHPAAPAAPATRRTVVHPGPREILPSGVPEGARQRALTEVREQREAVGREREDDAERRRVESERIRDPGRSLERPRRPEDHDRFHELYGVPEPVKSHTEFHERYMQKEVRSSARRTRLLLPDQPEWSAVKRAIVWAEILGTPKGLEP